MSIRYGERGEEFKKFIQEMLKLGKTNEEYIEFLSSDQNIKFYNNAFTALSADSKNNYEIFEQLGDLCVNKFIVFYTYRRFPNLLEDSNSVKIVSRVRIKYASKDMFYELAFSLGFFKFISAIISTDKYEKGIKTLKDNKKDLLEDTFESFFGCTEFIMDSHFGIGSGYNICYTILKSIFDNININLEFENLYDNKTIIKQLFDTHKELGKIQYEEEKLETDFISILYRITEEGEKFELGRGTGKKKIMAQQEASIKALENLKKDGIVYSFLKIKDV